MPVPQIDGETYFNNLEQSGYEELKDWTPEYYQTIKEADANLRFAGKTIDQMAQALEDWCANMFIDTMSEEVLARMEAFYYLDNFGRTLDERRRLLKAAQLGSGKMDIDRIKRIIKVYANTDCMVEFIHELNILLDAGDKKVNFTDFTTILGKQLPAHIKWHVHQEMRQDGMVYIGSVTKQTYIGVPIREMSGDREREARNGQTYAGSNVTVLQIASIVMGGGDRERTARDGQIYVGSEVTVTQFAAPVIDGGNRSGSITGTNGIGVETRATVSQKID